MLADFPASPREPFLSNRSKAPLLIRTYVPNLARLSAELRQAAIPETWLAQTVFA